MNRAQTIIAGAASAVAAINDPREARDLIAALQWALEPAEQLTGEVAA